MEPTWESNTMSCNGGASGGEIDDFNSAYNEMEDGTNLLYQTEISQQQEEEEEFVSYNDNQKLTDKQPVYENVCLLTQTPEDSLYFKQPIDGHPRPNQGTSGGDIEYFNTAYDEMIYRTNLPYQTDISQKQKQQFVSCTDNQKLNDKQPIDESVYWFPQTREESLYHKKQKELAEQKWHEMKCQELIHKRDPSAHQYLLYMQQEDENRRMLDEKRATVTVNVKNLCMKRVELYTYYQQNRPKDNSIKYWNQFVAEFFNQCAVKRWCVSSYTNVQQEVHQGAWKCDLCDNKPGKGFEASYAILANLFKIKYDSGIIEERFSLGIPEGRYSTTTGKLTLIYHKVVQETIYETLYVVREGKLLVDFSPNLKIVSFEFCAEPHKDFIRKSQIPTQINCDGDKYKSKEIVDEAELRDTCSKFVVSARRLEEMVEAPMLNEYGYNENYVLGLMVTAVLERMKKGTQFSCATGVGPSKNNAFLHDGPSSSSVNARVYDDDDGHFATE